MQLTQSSRSTMLAALYPLRLPWREMKGIPLLSHKRMLSINALWFHCAFTARVIPLVRGDIKPQVNVTACYSSQFRGTAPQHTSRTWSDRTSFPEESKTYNRVAEVLL